MCPQHHLAKFKSFFDRPTPTNTRKISPSCWILDGTGQGRVVPKTPELDWKGPCIKFNGRKSIFDKKKIYLKLLTTEWAELSNRWLQLGRYCLSTTSRDGMWVGYVPYCWKCTVIAATYNTVIQNYVQPLWAPIICSCPRCRIGKLPINVVKYFVFLPPIRFSAKFKVPYIVLPLGASISTPSIPTAKMWFLFLPKIL